MGKRTNSNQFLDRVISYLDGELSKEEERTLLMEIKQSPENLEKFNIEKSFREFIRSKVTRRPVSPTLVDNIKSKLNSAPSS